MEERDQVDDVELLRLALKAVERGSERAMHHFRSRGLLVETKTSPIDVVTVADRECEHAIVDSVLSERPDDGFLGEEGTSIEGTSGVRWILDPIDSTANFARGIPIWSVSLAAALDGQVLAAVVASPADGEVFSGSRTDPVRVNGLPVAPHVRRSLAESVLVFGLDGDLPMGRHGEVAELLLPRFGRSRSPGSPALGLAWTAAGRCDAAYYEMNLQPWDSAAGRFLCERAGLAVVEMDPSTPPPAGQRGLHVSGLIGWAQLLGRS